MDPSLRSNCVMCYQIRSLDYFYKILFYFIYISYLSFHCWTLLFRFERIYINIINKARIGAMMTTNCVQGWLNGQTIFIVKPTGRRISAHQWSIDHWDHVSQNLDFSRECETGFSNHDAKTGSVSYTEQNDCGSTSATSMRELENGWQSCVSTSYCWAWSVFGFGAFFSMLRILSMHEDYVDTYIHSIQEDYRMNMNVLLKKKKEDWTTEIVPSNMITKCAHWS